MTVCEINHFVKRANIYFQENEAKFRVIIIKKPKMGSTCQVDALEMAIDKIRKHISFKVNW